MDPISNFNEKANDTARTVEHEAGQIADEAKHRAKGAWSEAQDQAKSAMGTVQDQAKEAWDTAQHGAQDAVQKGSDFMQEYPVTTAISAFVVGFLVGRALTPHHERSLQDRYVTEPIHQTHAALLGLPLAIGALLNHLNKSAVKPLRKAAGV